MEIKKEEISKLIESLGNEPKANNNTPDFIEWMNQENPISNAKINQPKQKNKVRSKTCGNNTNTFIIVGAILFFVMWAGYGIFTFIANLLK